ncbi:MAG TPA: DegT/DnrJ/EryC1/StrS family aminotransferase [Candidatus Acidoferrales bacterium]
MRIPLAKPDIGEREIELVTEVLRSGQLSLGPRVPEFEQAFAEYVGTRYAIATNSGTSALHLCVRALEIGEGDDVLTTSFSFVASANCLLYEKATPVFVDIDPETMNIDPAAIRRTIAEEYRWDRLQSRHIHKHTGNILKAILPVHVFGQPCAMGEMVELAREFDLMILEDACEAIGAEYRGQPVGTFGDASVFAFYPNKQMTTAEGGMIVTDNAQVAAECRSLRNQGRDERSEWLSHLRLGFNYRLSDLHAALGLAQLERIQELLAKRARVAGWYTRHLAATPGMMLPEAPQRDTRSWFAYVIRIAGSQPRPRRDLLMNCLHARGIACQAYFPPIHRQPYFAEFAAGAVRELPRTEDAADRCVALPLFSQMTESEVIEVCDSVRHIAVTTAADGEAVVERRYAAAAGASD